MKRIFALTLAILMLISIFAGCGKGATPSQSTADTDVSDEPTTPDEPATPNEPTTPDEPATPDEPTDSHTHIWDKGTISGNQKNYKCFVCGGTKN